MNLQNSEEARERQYFDAQQLRYNIQTDERLFNQYYLGAKISKNGVTSQVYQAQSRGMQELEKGIAIKLLNKTIPEKQVAHEIQILKKLPQSEYIVEFYGVDYSSQKKWYALFFSLMKGHVDIRKRFGNLQLRHIRQYMRCLLEGLKAVHAASIFHGDIKPNNILYDPDTQEVKLIDWGHAEIYEQNKAYTPYKGTLYYKAPEMVLGNFRYDFNIDIWSAGVVFAGLLLKKNVFLRSQNNPGQLRKIIQFTGTDAASDYVARTNLKPDQDIRLILKESYEKKNFIDIFNKQKESKQLEEFQSEKAFDLVQKMLMFDPLKRVTAQQALSHPFFDQYEQN